MASESSLRPAPGSAGSMAEAADRFLASLATDQRAQAVFAVDDTAERTSWHYTPIPRQGLPLSRMERGQQRLAHQLVRTGLSRAGYNTVTTIMGLEALLDAREGWERAHPGRDPLLYYVSIFGTPGARRPWGWRFEGHHVSLHYTIAADRIIAPTPTFLGANPAEAELSPTTRLRPLAGVEDIARELLHALDPEQRRQAILAPVAPADIVLTNRRAMTAPVTPERRDDRQAAFSEEDAAAVSYTTEAKGVRGSMLSVEQRQILTGLIEEYLGRMPDEMAAIERDRQQAIGVEQVSFAWAGGIERGDPHYYRLQSPRVVVEYDNTQNDANHIHSVWRAPEDDFGARILARHYAAAH